MVETVSYLLVFDRVIALFSHFQRGKKKKEKQGYVVVIIYAKNHDLFRLYRIIILVLLTGGIEAQCRRL